jgi:hypothetical protein
MGQYLLDDKLPSNFDRRKYYFEETIQARWFVTFGRDKKAQKCVRICLSSAWVSKGFKYFLGPTNPENISPYLGDTSTNFTEFHTDRGHPDGVTFHSFFLSPSGSEVADKDDNAPAVEPSPENTKNPKKKSTEMTGENEVGRNDDDNMPTTASSMKQPLKNKSPVKKSPDVEPDQHRKRSGKKFRNI